MLEYLRGNIFARISEENSDVVEFFNKEEEYIGNTLNKFIFLCLQSRIVNMFVKLAF